MKSILAVLCVILAFVLGFGSGLGIFAYGIWTIVLMVKGTIAVSFLGIIKIILCWFCAGLVGWAVAATFLFLAGVLGFSLRRR